MVEVRSKGLCSQPSEMSSVAGAQRPAQLLDTCALYVESSWAFAIGGPW